MIRRTAPLALAAALVLAGCNARDSAGLKQSGFGDASHVEGGYGSPFYAEVVYAKDGGKARIYLFGTVAAYDAFVATKEVPETGHKKVMRRGTTLVVQTLAGSAGKEDPGFSDRLVAQYTSRHPIVETPETAPAAEAKPAEAAPAAKPAEAAPAAAPVEAKPAEPAAAPAH